MKKKLLTLLLCLCIPVFTLRCVPPPVVEGQCVEGGE